MLAKRLDDLAAFRRLESMRFVVIRLAVSWGAASSAGCGRVDRFAAEAERSDQPPVLSGMKAPDWPEFHVPAPVAAAGPDDRDPAPSRPSRGRAASGSVLATGAT